MKPEIIKIVVKAGTKPKTCDECRIKCIEVFSSVLGLDGLPKDCLIEESAAEPKLNEYELVDGGFCSDCDLFRIHNLCVIADCENGIFKKI